MSDAIFIYPTDTVWGIGGNIHEEGMALKVNKIKGYDEVKPLSVLFYNLDMLSDYFDLELFDRDWLLKLFSMGVTLGLPLIYLKKEIPKEAFSGSDFLCVRVLEIPHVKELVSLAGGPVYTTSFNEKNQSPLLNQDEAVRLRDQICPEAQVIGSSSGKLSGHSSTIAVYKKTGGFDILRAGDNVKEIQNHFKLLST